MVNTAVFFMVQFCIYLIFSVVTGSTDGIGRAYATELAKRGMNLVLVSRNLEKLNAVASHLSKYEVKSHSLQKLHICNKEGILKAVKTIFSEIIQ